MFRANGRSGYVVKPPFLCFEDKMQASLYDPFRAGGGSCCGFGGAPVADTDHQVTLTIKVRPSRTV